MNPVTPYYVMFGPRKEQDLSSRSFWCPEDNRNVSYKCAEFMAKKEQMNSFIRIFFQVKNLSKMIPHF
jgi:hypothetical protein